MLLVLCDWHSQKEEKEVGQESGCARSPMESCGLFRATTFICYRYQCDTKVAAFIKAEKQLESLRAGLRQIFSKSGLVQAASQIMWFAPSSTVVSLSD